MKTLQIVASNCVDVDIDEDGKINYPQLKDINAKERRLIYWKCTYLFFASSIRFNPKAQHILYTNERNDAIDGKIDLKKKLIDLGVEIRYHDFSYFKPPNGYSNTFKNAFYKLDVIQKLGEQSGVNCILLDTDCVWIKSAESINQVFEQNDSILLYDPYTSENPSVRPTNLTKDNMPKTEVCKVYQMIDENYPSIEPRVFGGELIGGSSENLRKVAEMLSVSFIHILQKFSAEKQLPKFPNGKNIFSGMEYWSSMVYNQLPMPWIDAKIYTRRIWTAFSLNEVRKEDLNLTIWHLPAEKDKGIPLLYRKALNPNSKFWTLSNQDFIKYTSQYLGITASKLNLKRLPFVWDKMMSELKKKFKK